MIENFVEPKVFFIGATALDIQGVIDYLTYTDQKEFLEDIERAKEEGVADGEILCSFYAKLCYASLTDKKNKNISKVRSIANNILSTIDSQHGSVFEHCSLNFVVTDCSRVYTHELVRHRVGTAFSQTSGRYVRSDVLKLIYDPILDPAKERVLALVKHIEQEYKLIEQDMQIDTLTDFTKKKKITSAMRRVMPNGQANEIGFSVNLRTLRQTIESRTSEHAEWEIRLIFNQIYQIAKNKYPLMFADSTTTIKDNQFEVTFKNKKI